MRPSEINFRLIVGVLQSNPMTVSIQDLSYSLMIYAMIKFVHTERFDLNSVSVLHMLNLKKKDLKITSIRNIKGMRLPQQAGFPDLQVD